MITIHQPGCGTILGTLKPREHSTANFLTLIPAYDVSHYRSSELSVGSYCSLKASPLLCQGRHHLISQVVTTNTTLKSGPGRKQ